MPHQGTDRFNKEPTTTTKGKWVTHGVDVEMAASVQPKQDCNYSQGK